MNSSKLALTISAVVLVHLIGGAVILLQPGCKSDSPAPAPTPPPAAGNATAANNAPQLVEPTRPPAVTPITPLPEGNLSSSEPLTTGTEPTGTTPAASGPSVTYEVKKGDSLSKIAKVEKVSLSSLMAANNLTSTSKLKVGQTLTIPVSSSSTTASPSSVTPAASEPAATTAEAGGGTYVVKSGDSLSKIAHKNGTTLSALKAANHLTSDSLHVGQKLTLPSGATPSAAASTPSPASEPAASATSDTGGVYVVKSGDTIDVIAKKHGVKASEIIKLNNIKNPTQLHIGQKLKLPTGTAPTASTTALASPTTPASSTATPAATPTPVPSVTQTAAPGATPASAAPAAGGPVDENVPVTPVSN
jgi:LysM repeat protein